MGVTLHQENLISKKEPYVGFGPWDRRFAQSWANPLSWLFLLFSSQCKRELRQPLPPQYALELLTVYAWEQGSKEADFVTAEGFQTVLQLVVNYRNLCVYWTKYYDRNHPVIGPYLSRQLQKPRPVILDPADPTGNVGADNLPGGWERLAGKARVWLTYPCFKKGNGSPVGSWNIRI
ncbi:2'-5'-oligoadenylate synthetase 1 [Phyllostomus discolor]|uniref:2'-5'-oligoadenylate synthetase 1 n=1 Tax=Phyllostomus discolor TaxID=89673 RepID=A0A833YTI1_9CHIR|nr:2'-5'-oligoadenylate synthetase 1 [Phyllostomus discolor]